MCGELQRLLLAYYGTAGRLNRSSRPYKDEAPFLRDRAVKALQYITGQDFGEDQAKWQDWRERN